MAVHKQNNSASRRRIACSPFSLGLVLVALIVGGCKKSATSQLRTSAPSEAAAAAMKLYDKNSDGKLAADELNACPALVDALPRIDDNRDKVIEQSELEGRFTEHDGMSDVVGFDLHVSSAGRPLSGATVTFEPEPFMGDGKQSYSGTSNEEGACYLAAQEVRLPGVPTGFYKVHIVQQAEGVDATLGCEVADDVPNANRMAFDVKAGGGARGG